MAWTNPRTWVSGEVLTAALLNTHLRDNLLALGSPVWQSYTPTLTNVSATIIEARYTRRGNSVRVVGQINLTAAPTNIFYISAPVVARDSAAGDVVAGNALAVDTSATIRMGGITYVDTLLDRFAFAGFGGVGNGGDAAPTVPFTWASGDVLRFDAEYEVV